MIISDKKVQNLEEAKIIVPTYRVLNKYEISGANIKGYLYYSQKMEHYLYFLIRKIFKQIDASYDISFNNPRDKHLVDKINQIIELLGHDDISFVGKYFWLDRDFAFLMDDNSYSNHNSHREGLVERVDTTIYGGGYGLKGLWMELFNLLTYCEYEHVLSTDLVIAYLKELSTLLEKFGATSLKRSKIEAGKILLRSSTPVTISESILVDKSKEISNVLTRINQEDLLKPYRCFSKYPESTIEAVTKGYELKRKMILDRIKK